MTDEDIIARANAAFARNDALKAELRASEQEIRQIMNEYRLTQNVWFTRPEQLRFAVEARESKKVA